MIFRSSPSTNIQIYHFSSPIGLLQITGDEPGITGIYFVEEKKETESSKIPSTIKLCMKELDLYFKGKLKVFTTPVTPEGTEFQKRVWSELSKIPFCKTSSYLELAKKLGNVKSIRAAGRANGKNPLSIIIPCHRVIGSDGTLTGYAEGLWRKKWLLEHEKKVMGVGQSVLFESVL